MQKTTDRNLTVRLPTRLLRRLKAESAADGMSMNAYLERLLAKALTGSKNDAQQMAMTRLMAQAKDGLYKLDQPLTREQAHNRHA
jgi:plasmid stability protein